MKPTFQWNDAFLLNEQLNDDERAIVEAAHTFCQERLQTRVLMAARHEKFDREIMNEAGAMGFLGSTIEGYGCAGLSYVAYGLIAREVERVDSGYRSAISVQSSLVMHPINEYGSEAQRQKYLPKLATGEWVGCFGLTEPNHGSDPASMLTRAKPVDGGYLLNGAKMWITNAPIADVFTVVARTDAGSQGSSGLSAFIVERGSPGLRTGPAYKKMGQAGSPVSDVYFEDCRIPADHVIGGQEGVGFKTIMKVLNKQRLHLSALCTGPAIRMLELAIEHTQQRQQFGQPVGNFQLLQAMVADSQTEIFAAKSMILEAARARDRGEDVALTASMCKYFASEMCGRVADRCVQMFGGAGYVADFSPIERYYRDVRLFRLYEGTSQIHQMNIAKLVLRDQRSA